MGKLRDRAVAAVNAAAQHYEQGVKRQLRSNFKSSSPGFQNGVRIFTWETENSVAAVVSLGGLQSHFTEEREIEGAPWLWVPLPDAPKFGLGRLGGNGQAVYRAIASNFRGKYRFVPAKAGSKVLQLRQQKEWIAVYLLTPRVVTPQKLFLEPLKQESDRILQQHLKP